MTTLHPWLSTPEALTACDKAVEVAVRRRGFKALALGRDELLSVARSILTACAEPKTEDVPTHCATCAAALIGVRKGSKFCSPQCRKANSNGRRPTLEREAEPPLPDVPHGYIGSMWDWPEDDRYNYALREVGLALGNHAVVEWTKTQTFGIPSSNWIDSTELADAEPQGLAFYVFKAVAGGSPGYLRASAEGFCYRTPVTAYENQGLDIPIWWDDDAWTEAA